MNGPVNNQVSFKSGPPNTPDFVITYMKTTNITFRALSIDKKISGQKPDSNSKIGRIGLAFECI